MPWWGWITIGAILLGSEMLLIDAQFYLVFLGLAASGLNRAFAPPRLRVLQDPPIRCSLPERGFGRHCGSPIAWPTTRP